MSALADPFSKIRALDLSADDYVVKPFDLDEVLARIRALLRRNTTDRSVVIDHHDLKIDTQNGTVFCNDQQIKLGKLEYQLLVLLLRRRGQHYTKEILLDVLYNGGGDVSSNVVEALVFSLRNKLKAVSSENYVKSKRGFGYFIEQ
jgi:DNA-binding response OmpR family regulator